MRIKSFLITAIFSGIILCSAGIASAQAVDNSALIAQIQAQIAQLTAQLQTMLAQQDTVTATWCHNFNTNLGFANSGTSEVSQLHIALQKQGISYAPDGDNVYSDGTSRAVIIFQERYASEILTPVRLTRGTGFTASSTRAKLNALYGCSQAAQTTPTVPTIATCAESNWTSTLNPSTCPASGQQTKTWTKTGTCQNGAFHPSVETVICTPVTPQSTTCTSFTYSDWSACSASGTQTRTVTSSLPAGCVGGNSILSQACTYTQPSTGSTCTSPFFNGVCYATISAVGGGQAYGPVVAATKGTILPSQYTPYSDDPYSYESKVWRFMNPSTSSTHWRLDIIQTGTQYKAWLITGAAAPNPWLGVNYNGASEMFYAYGGPNGNYAVIPIVGIQPGVTFTLPGTISGVGRLPDLVGATATITLMGTPPSPAPAPAGTCTSFKYSYSGWSACFANGTQTRTVGEVSSLPAGCVGEGPILSQACTYTPPSTGSTCTSVGISNWSACSASGTQTRTVTSSSPVGCTINPAWSFSRACTYVQPSTVTTDCTPYYSDIIAYNPALHVAVRSGETRNIYWSAPGASASSTVSISISCENDPSIISIVGGISARSGFYSWTVPNNAHFTSVPRLCSGYKVSYLTGGPVVCPK